MYSTNYGFALTNPDAPGRDDKTYQREYTWNERNLLTRSVDSQYQVQYRYGADGQRAVKYTVQNKSQTLYFNQFFQTAFVAGQWEESKHILWVRHGL